MRTIVNYEEYMRQIFCHHEWLTKEYVAAFSISGGVEKVEYWSKSKVQSHKMKFLKKGKKYGWPRFVI